MQEKIRVRFAPSPTGPLHIGGIRTALYNYLLAKKHKGAFILRIEDTDQGRFVPGASAYILEALSWLGIMPDEGPLQGGNYGPYQQSERKEIYQQYALQLIEASKAYYAFDTPEEIEAMRLRLQAAKVASPQYNAISREIMKNSLTLPKEEVAERLAAGQPYVIRFKMPHQEIIRFYDQVRGWVKVNTNTLDDKVLIKSDGMATYHLANVVDDYLMEISHVIRGEEWLPSAPLHILLYQYFGWEKAMPHFVHLPILLKPSGTGKLSKRDAETQGFPIFPIAWRDPYTQETKLGFREKGYLPEALLNFLALLGWSPGDNREIFSLEALIEHFSIERIGKSGVKFDIQKAMWFNAQYLRDKPDEALAPYLSNELDARNIPYDPIYVQQICHLIKERTNFIQDFWEMGAIFFDAPKQYDMAIIQRKWSPLITDFVQNFIKILTAMDDFESSKLKSQLTALMHQHDMRLNDVLPILRILLTGISKGPDLMKMMELMGKARTIAYLEKGCTYIRQNCICQ